VRLVERVQQAYLAFMAPPSATWYVVEDLQPLGWRIMHTAPSYDGAAEWLQQSMPTAGDRVRVLRADLWEIRTLAHMSSDDVWLRLGDMARKANRWLEHEHEVRLLTAARATERDPERHTGQVPVLPVQHGTGWPVDAPTTPVPGLSVENDPHHVGTRLERALGREERRARAARHVRQDDENVGGQ
jgi:hypothetical protein